MTGARGEEYQRGASRGVVLVHFCPRLDDEKGENSDTEAPGLVMLSRGLFHIRKRTMSFEDVETITRHNKPPEASISYMRPARKGVTKNGAKPQLTVTIPTTVCGTAKSELFKLMVGTGENAGKIRIKGTKEKTGIKPAEHAHYFTFRFGHVPRLGEDIFDGEHRPVRKVGEDEFEIDVPTSWFNGED